MKLIDFLHADLMNLIERILHVDIDGIVFCFSLFLTFNAGRPHQL